MDTRAYPAYALAALVAVVYLIGVLSPFWTFLFAGALAVLLVSWIVIVIADLARTGRAR